MANASMHNSASGRAENDLLAYANACNRSSPPSEEVSARSRSQSPRFNIADFERGVQFPAGAHTSSGTRETSYASQANIDDLDFQRSSGENTPVPNRFPSTRNLNTSFLKRSASKLLPKAIATANLPTPPSSGASSPTKSLSSFISTATTSSNLSSSASRASVRARTASRVLFDNYFNGDSNNVLSPAHSRSNSFVGGTSASAAATRASQDGYEQDDEVMAAQEGYTRQPVRARPRRSPTMESTASTYAGKLGSWFSKQASPRTAVQPQSPQQHDQDDPLLNLSTHAALFPYGPLDPLNPSSFNDLLAAAEAVISTYQNAYRQRCAELSQARAEVALREEEVEECETRAQCLKAQLRDMGEQCTAQTERADSLEAMLRTPPPPQFESSETLVEESAVPRGQTAASDSGFESDGDSILTRSPIKDRATIARPAPAAAAGTRSAPQFSHDLRTENEMLRQRVLELEGAVDSCLDMISNPLASL